MLHRLETHDAVRGIQLQLLYVFTSPVPPVPKPGSVRTLHIGVKVNMSLSGIAKLRPSPAVALLPVHCGMIIQRTPDVSVTTDGVTLCVRLWQPVPAVGSGWGALHRGITFTEHAAAWQGLAAELTGLVLSNGSPCQSTSPGRRGDRRYGAHTQAGCTCGGCTAGSTGPRPP